MIPGFVSVYKSKVDKLPHIYFYPGYDDYDRNIYRIDGTAVIKNDIKYEHYIVFKSIILFIYQNTNHLQ